MKESQVRAWEVLGAVFITVAGSMLHFAFEWSGFWKPMALIAAVNESTWEHLKIAFWPALLWGLLEWIVWGRSKPNFLSAKAAGLLATPLLIVAVFYGYKAILGHHSLPLDILIFVLAVVVGQWLSHRVESRAPFSSAVRGAAPLVLLVLVVAFSLLSYRAPRNFLFEDPNYHQYGILRGVE
jgi:hypothetical protein